ncbi:c-type cytochrome [Cupriavidus sp. IDO]|uniref:c-type cytochrome n=1 Tax=Cupriavidus sp. IDO TaxID=1539142 RepID=UPI00057996A4|nr:cytochrome c [Cupriavidus sp. IDO]KWR87994.1 hypothetical protein RM96_22050 [Cupriavidus sp. IDO]
MTRSTRWYTSAAVLGAAAAIAGTPASAQSTPGDNAIAFRNYTLNCMGCHGENGAGVPGKIPPLRGALGLFVHSDAGRRFIISVPGASNSALTDDELAAVTNLLLKRLSPEQLPRDFRPYTGTEIAAYRRPALADVPAVRHKVISELQSLDIPIRYEY